MERIKPLYRSLRRRWNLYCKINWVKTIYINWVLFDYDIAKKLPIIIFGKCHLANLKGEVIFQQPIKTGMITFGHKFEVFTKESGCAEVFLQGKWFVNGNIQFGYDFKLYIENDASFTSGHMCTFANQTKVICTNKIILKDHVKIGDESQLLDSNFHDLIDVDTNENIPMKGEIFIDSYVAVGNRTTLMKQTKLPSYSLLGSSSLCNKDFLSYGSNNLFAGTPAKFIKSGIARNWQKEEKAIEEYLTIKL